MTTTSVASPADVPASMRTGSASRPAATSTTPGGTAPAAASRAGDSVTLSSLAAALKGNALTMFNEALDGAQLLQRGQRKTAPRDDARAQQDVAPPETTSAAPKDPRSSAYFLDIEEGGDEAAQKISALGISLNPFSAFGDTVRRLIDDGAFDYE